MTYDVRSDRLATVTATRESPAVEVVRLTSAMVSDTADLTTYAKALRIWNGAATSVTLMVTPLSAAVDTAAVPITVPAGAPTYEPISVRRIWATGSTGLAAGLDAGTVEVLLLTV